MRPFIVALAGVICLFAGRPAQAESPPIRTDQLGDPLPSGARFRLGTTRFWHRVGVDSVAFSPDGAMVATGGCDEMRIWNAATGKELFCSPQVRKAGALAFAPDGKILAAGGGFLDDKLTILAMPGGKILHQSKAGHGGIEDLLFAPNGKTLITAGRDGHIRFWDVGTARQTRSIAAHAKEISSLAMSPDGKKLLTGSQDHTTRLWDLATGKELAHFQCADCVNSVAFHPDGTVIALASDDGKIHLWDIGTGKKVRELENQSTRFFAVAFSPDGKSLASVNSQYQVFLGSDREKKYVDLDAPTVVLWDPATGKQVRSWGRNGGSISRLRYSPDAKLLATTGCKLRMWETASGRETPTLPGHQSSVYSIALSPDGRTLASRSYDKTVRAWDLITRKETHWHPLGDRSISEARIAPNGETMVWSDGKSLHLADIAKGKMRPGLDYDASKPAFSADGRWLAAVAIRRESGARKEESKVLIFDFAQRRLVHEFTVASKSVLAMEFSPDGKLLATADYDGIVFLLDAATGKVIQRFESQPCCSTLAFSPDGSLLVTGTSGAGHTARLWEVPSGKALAELKAEGQTLAVAFSPDGRMVAAGQSGIQALVQVWEVTTRRERIRYSGHQSMVHSLAFSPDSKLLFSGGDDTTILAWEVIAPGVPPARTTELLAKSWEDLGSADASRAFDCIRAMIGAPAEATAFLGKQLRPVPQADQQRIGRLLDDLDNKEFQVREKARQELEQMEEVARAALEAVIEKGRPTLEQRTRVEQLLAKLDPRNSPERLRTRRAIEVLEHIATPASGRLLEDLAGGASEAQITREARGARDRLIPRQRP